MWSMESGEHMPGGQLDLRLSLTLFSWCGFDPVLSMDSGSTHARWMGASPRVECFLLPRRHQPCSHAASRASPAPYTCCSRWPSGSTASWTPPCPALPCPALPRPALLHASDYPQPWCITYLPAYAPTPLGRRQAAVCWGAGAGVCSRRSRHRGELAVVELAPW